MYIPRNSNLSYIYLAKKNKKNCTLTTGAGDTVKHKMLKEQHELRLNAGVCKAHHGAMGKEGKCQTE